MEEMGQVLRNPVFADMNPIEAIQSSLSSFMMILFLMMPLMVPVTIAAYSIVGEKVSRSLEPLLAAPITTSRLLVAKGLAAAIPGIGMAWICYALFLICARFLVASDRVFAFFLNPMWLIAMFLLAPLLTIMAVNVGIIVSSRTSDPRAAEQLGSLVVLPLLVLLFGPMVGLIMLNSSTFWICSAIVALIYIGLIYLGVALFQRETILTRWK
jgi:ABC-2 type transport system permease protein